MKCLIKERDKWKLTLRNPNISIEERENASNTFKYYRNKINNRKKYDETIYKKQKYEENKHSSENTWKLAKKFMNWKKTASPHQILSNNIIESKAFNVAETMNSFFSSKVHGLKSSIQSLIWSPENCQNIMKNKNCKLRLQFPSKLKIAKILKNLSNSRCSAIDGLDNFILKVSSEIIVDHIHHLICLSLMQEKISK